MYIPSAAGDGDCMWRALHAYLLLLTKSFGGTNEEQVFIVRNGVPSPRPNFSGALSSVRAFSIFIVYCCHLWRRGLACPSSLLALPRPEMTAISIIHDTNIHAR